MFKLRTASEGRPYTSNGRPMIGAVTLLEIIEVFVEFQRGDFVG